MSKNDLESLKNLLGEKERKIEEGVLFVNNLIEKKQKERNIERKKFIKGNYSKKLYENKSIDFNLISPPKEQNKENPIIFFDIKIGDKKPKRIEIELFKDKLPKICEKFIYLCTGEKGKKIYYKGKKFHRIIKNSIIQVGDFENKDKRKVSSEDGKNIDDQNFFYSHCRKGL